jgi:hypothetical protein
MPTEAHCKTEARRLKALPGPGREDPDARRQIGRTLMEVCGSNAHLTAVVERLLRSQQYYPAPMAVIEAAEQTADPDKMRGTTAGQRCSVCSGSGHISAGDFLVTHHSGRRPTCQRLTLEQEIALRGHLRGNQSVCPAASPCPACSVREVAE